jgi:predicted TIM-barrel fold metal-dependent hydrolase
VLGSDFPHLLSSIEKSVSSIRDLTIPAQEKARIFGETALGILNNVSRV